MNAAGNPNPTSVNWGEARRCPRPRQVPARVVQRPADPGTPTPGGFLLAADQIDPDLPRDHTSGGLLVMGGVVA